MSIRDRVLPKIDKARSIIQSVGLRRFAVVLRRRVWSGAYVNDGTVTVEDITITPLPRVRNSFSSKAMSPQSLEYLLTNGPVGLDRVYTIDRITPRYTSPAVGGYRSQDLHMRPSPDVRNVDPVVILVGDDGYARECVQVSLEQDRSFGYRMVVKESDRPRTALSSLAASPASMALVADDASQAMAVATFEDSQTSDVTPICAWSSSDETVATVNMLGVITAVATGTATITAELSGAWAEVSVTVS